jgi:hypothetical protein
MPGAGLFCRTATLLPFNLAAVIQCVSGRGRAKLCYPATQFQAVKATEISCFGEPSNEHRGALPAQYRAAPV